MPKFVGTVGIGRGIAATRQRQKLMNTWMKRKMPEKIETRQKSFRCGNCKTVKFDKPQYCFYCLGKLCYDCWDRVGHCGHRAVQAMKDKEARKRKIGNEQG